MGTRIYKKNAYVIIERFLTFLLYTELIKKLYCCVRCVWFEWNGLISPAGYAARSPAEWYNGNPGNCSTLAVVLTWVTSSQVEVGEVNHVVVALLFFIKEPNFCGTTHDIVGDHTLKTSRSIRNWPNYARS